MPMKKILIVGQHWKKSLGGASTHIISLVNYLADKGYNVVVISVIPFINEDIHEQKGNITTYYISPPFKKSRFISFNLYEKKKIVNIINKENPDIIDIHSTVPIYGPVGLKLNMPKILTVHGIRAEEMKYKSGIKGYIKRIIALLTEKKILRAYSNIIVDTKYVEDKIRPFTKAKIYVNPIGIDRSWFDVVSEPDGLKVIAVGGIEPRKGYDFLLKAWKYVIMKIPEAELHIVGMIRDKKYNNILKKIIEEENIQKSVFFKGYVEDVRKELKSSYLYVMPSREESQGIAILEAMACGLPVIASNIGGIPDIFDKECGKLVESDDSEGLAKEIIAFLKDREYRDRIGRNAAEHAKNFTIEKTADKTLSIYINAYNSDKNKLDIA